MAQGPGHGWRPPCPQSLLCCWAPGEVEDSQSDDRSPVPQRCPAGRCRPSARPRPTRFCSRSRRSTCASTSTSSPASTPPPTAWIPATTTRSPSGMPAARWVGAGVATRCGGEGSAQMVPGAQGVSRGPAGALVLSELSCPWSLHTSVACCQHQAATDTRLALGQGPSSLRGMWER